MNNEIIATILVSGSVLIYVSFLLYSIFDLRRERKNNQSLAIK